jgi:PKD repeat protein
VDDKTLKGHVDYYINDCMCYGVDAYINQDPLAKAYARQYVLSLLSRPISGDDDMPIRGKLFALGVLYDFLYDDLEEPLKKEIRIEILDMVKYVDNKWHYVSHANAGGHSRFGNISVLVGLLPIYHDIEEDNAGRYYTYLRYVVSNWRNIFNPLQEWVNQKGSHSMGWAYGASYSTFYPYMAWEFATDEESWLTDWQRGKAYFNLYGLRNDYNENDRNRGAYDNFPFWEDVWASDYSPNLQGLQVLFSAGYYGDEHAQWFYNHMKKKNQNGWMFDDNPWDILYNNFSSAAGTPPDDLPLSGFFPHSGFVVMRDSWDFQKNTLMVFKSSSFYAAGHHHKDQNAFTIYYKGPLAIDAGTYEATGGWGSSHFWNYYTRSVAHNTMLIYDPSERFRGYSNDGGQRFFLIDDPALKDVIEGGANHLDGIQRYEENNIYTYTMGDATKAYRPSKLTKFTRSIVYLRNHSYDHPAIIVYDEVIATKPEYKKTYLLHSINEPVVQGTRVTITNDDGLSSSHKAKLFQETILPENARIVKIGGRENNQEFFVWDDGKGVPHNYNEEAAYENPSQRQKRELREGGQWRVEISPGDTVMENEFLHVLSVTDGETTNTAVKTRYVHSANMDGVIVQDNDGKESSLVMFCKDPSALNDSVLLPGDMPFRQILIAGLDTNAQYTVHELPGGFVIKKTSSGKMTSTGEGTLLLDPSLHPVLASMQCKVNPCNNEVLCEGHAISDHVTEWLWDFGDGTGSSLQSPVHVYDTAGSYTVSLITSAGSLTDTCKQNITLLPVIKMPEVTDQEHCGSGSVTLAANGGGGVFYKWYASPEGGAPLATGDTFTTPELQSSRDYYVASVIPQPADTVQGAKPDSSGEGNYYKWEDELAVWGLQFDASKDIIINSVKVYNGESESGSYTGDRTFTVVSDAGDTIAATTVGVVQGEQRLTLNLPVPAGKGYRLLADRHVGLWRNTTGNTFPYPVGNAVSITAGVRFDGLTNDNYYFFFDWITTVTRDSSSCRSKVSARIIPQAKAAFDYNTYDTTVYFTNLSSGDSYFWDFDDGSSSSEAEPVHNYRDYNTYHVKLVARNSCGADSTEKVVVIEDISQGSPLMKRGHVILYPNPAGDVVFFRSDMVPGTTGTVYIFNNTGKNVKTLKNVDLTGLRVNVAALPSGIYFMKILPERSEPLSLKFIILR